MRSFILFISVVLVPSWFVVSQDRMLHISVKPTYIDISGANLHLLDKILVKTDVSTLGTLSYSSKTNRVDLVPSNRLSPFIEIKYDLGNRWSINGDFLMFSSDGAKSGLFKAPDTTATISYLNSVYLWEGNFRLPYQRNFWFQNDKHSSGFSPIRWSGKTGFGTTSSNLYASYSMLLETDRSMNFIFGLKFMTIDQTLRREIRGEIYLYEPDLDGNLIPDDFDGDGIIEEYQNDILLYANNEVNMGFSIGPLLGMSGGFNYIKWSFKGSLSQSWVPVSVDVKGSFTDIDNMKWIDPATGFTKGIFKMVGRSPYRESIESIIPVLTAIADVSYRLTENWSIGVGVYYSLLQNVPTVPTFSYRDMTWKTHIDDLSFSGVSIIITNASRPPGLRISVPAPAPIPEGYEAIPQPIGGYPGIIKNVIYPMTARKSGIEGKVFIKTYVDSTGKVTKTIVQRGFPGTGLDEAAIEAIIKTAWKPAIREGKPVGVWLTIPINFRLK